MCFSATSSFITAAILIPAGIYCIKEANQLDKPYWAFALLPFMFGLQQFLEGGVWHSLSNDDLVNARIFALGFLLFSHIFWLGWIAFASYLIEPSPPLKRLFKFFTVTGVLFGTMMYIPLLFNPDWLNILIVHHSISYDFIFLSDPLVSQTKLGIFYSALILLPLVLSSDRYLNKLGALIFIAGIVSWIYFQWVFVSVWCFFAAIVSIYVFYIIARSVQANRIADIAI